MKSTLLSAFCVALMVVGAACSSNPGGSTETGSTSTGNTSGAGGTNSAAKSTSSGDAGGEEGTGGTADSGGAQASGGAQSGGSTGTRGASTSRDSATGGNSGAAKSTSRGGAGGASSGAKSSLSSGAGGDKGTGGATSSGGTPASGGTQGGTEIRARKIETRGFTFDVLETASSGEPVLLLHGFPDTSLEWTTLMPVLSAKGYHCLAPDQRGYSPGARPTEVGAYEYEELVADAFAIADELGDRFHLIGHDWGANIAWLMLEKDPSRIASFTAISIPHYQVWARSVYDDNEMAGYLSMLNTWMTEGKGEAFWTADQLRRMWTAKPADQTEKTIAHMTEPGAMTAALNWYRASRGHKRVIEEFDVWEVTVPTLLIHGSEDVGERSVTDTAALMKGPYRVVRPKGGHFIVDEQPQTVTEEILKQLQAYPIE